MSSTTTTIPSWHSLPVEMKLAIVDNLDLDDARAFAKVNQESYMLSIPALFRVRLLAFPTVFSCSRLAVREHCQC